METIQEKYVPLNHLLELVRQYNLDGVCGKYKNGTHYNYLIVNNTKYRTKNINESFYNTDKIQTLPYNSKIVSLFDLKMKELIQKQ